jgi:hypothetical protein
MKGIHVYPSNHHQRAQKPEMSQPRPPNQLLSLNYYYLPTAALLINLKNIDIKLSLSTNQSK